MAENYKHLYEQTKIMVEKYQDEIVPGLREQLEKRVEVVRCRECRWRNDPNLCPMCFLVAGEYDDYTMDNGFCDRGERKDNG